MAKLSILIPAMASQSLLEETLLSVLENRPADCEVIVAHDSSFVDPYDLSDEVRFVAVDSLDTTQMINAGIEACSYPWLNLLLPGSQVEAGWCQHPLELFDQDNNLASISPSLKLGKRRRPVLGLDYRVYGGRRIVTSTRARCLAPTLDAGFYKTSALRFMHGFAAGFGSLAEIELGLRLRCAGYHTISCSGSRIRRQVPSVPHRPTWAYQGGRMRAQLWHLARRAGIVSGGSWAGLLSEFPLHGFSPRTLSAIRGFLSARPDAIELLPRNEATAPTPSRLRSHAPKAA